jgi:hypothetical protein
VQLQAKQQQNVQLQQQPELQQQQQVQLQQQQVQLPQQQELQGLHQGQALRTLEVTTHKAAACSRATPSLGRFIPPKIKQEQHHYGHAAAPIESSSYSHDTARAVAAPSCSTATAATAGTASGSLVPLAAVNSRAVTLEELGRVGAGGALQELLARAIEHHCLEGGGTPTSTGGAAAVGEGSGLGQVVAKEEQMDWEAAGGGGRGHQAGATPENAGGSDC